jgi:hypothetical protein
VGQPFPGTPLVLITVALVALLQFPAHIMMKSISMSLGVFLNETIVIAGLPLLLVIVMDFDRSRLFSLRAPKKETMILAILLSIPTALVIDYAVSASEVAFPLPQQYHDIIEQLMAFEGPKEFVLKFFVLCIVPGFCEEIFFRGFCQTSLEARWGKTSAIFVTAIIFALLHGNPWYIHLYFLLGCYLSWVYAVGRTLWIPIVCHIINNAWTFINAALDIKYPLHRFSDPKDVTLILFGIMLTTLFALIYRHIAARSER